MKKEKCAACEDGLDAVIEHDNNAMEKYGWYAHCVPCDDDQTPFGFNYHTHGFVETLDHPDIQIVLPIPFEYAHSIAHTIFERIKAGETFVAGQSAEKIIRGFPVKFCDATECGRAVIRVLFPDKHGLFEDSEDPHFNLQHT